MPKPLNDNDAEASNLPAATSLFRALLRKKWLNRDSNQILPDAYLPRLSGKDDDGLSVTVSNADTDNGLIQEAELMASSFKNTYGVALLNVGEVRAIDERLNVVRAPNKGNPNHALLTGVPRLDDDLALAERLAGQLARISQNIL